jgi:transcriptional regulator of acetoin/glycerol metabolism
VLRTAAVMAAGEPQIMTAHLPDDFLEDASRMTARSGVPVQPAAATPVSVAAAARVAEAVVPAAPRGEREEAPIEAPHTMEQAEIGIIRAALDAAGGNISAASKRLGISRNTIYRKLRAHGHDRSS